jgi:hypothetical protein
VGAGVWSGGNAEVKTDVFLGFGAAACLMGDFEFINRRTTSEAMIVMGRINKTDALFLFCRLS